MDIQGNTDQPSDVRTNKMCDAEFWYSRNAVISFLALLFLIVLSISYLIPPFQSPDEFMHLERAYLLSKGKVFLNTKDDETGGYIDSGLLDYMKLFSGIPRNYHTKLHNQDFLASKQIGWSGKKEFSRLPNTAVYFPLPYIPQALAFIVGEKSGLTVSNTYYLARFFSLTATIILLGCAFLLYPTPLIVIAAFITPMSLFQLGSASLDSVSFAICALAASLYMRGGDNKYSFTPFMLYALTACVFALATSRLNLFPLMLLPAFLYINRRSYVYLLPSAILCVAALAWIGYSIATVHDMPGMGIIFYCLHNPVSFCNVLYTNLLNGLILTAYWRMFVGVLGWLDTPLGSGLYGLFGILLCCLAAVSFQRNMTCLFNWRNGLLFCVTIASFFLLFLIMLLASWTPETSNFLIHIQGRYFTPVVILLSYAIFDRRLSRIELRLGLIIIFLMLYLSIASMSPKLLDRYWLSSNSHISPKSQIDFNADAYNGRGFTYGKLGFPRPETEDLQKAARLDG